MENNKRSTMKSTDNFYNRMEPPENIEQQKWLEKVEAAKSREAAITTMFDELLIDGEGTVHEKQYWDGKPVIRPEIYKWVRIYRGAETKKAIGTFYLSYRVNKPDELAEMWLARVRKGLPPNPSESHPGGFYFQPADIARHESQALLDSLGDAEHLARRDLKDYRGAEGVKGIRPTMHVSWEERPNYDHVWVLDGYRVRSTKLAPVLHTFRRAGIQRIPVDMIRRAVQAL